MIPSDLTYDFPQAAFLGLAGFIILFLCWQLYLYRQNALKSLADPLVLQSTLIPRSTLTYWTKSICLVLIWVMAVLALMEPKGNGRYPDEFLPNKNTSKTPEQPATVRRRAHDIILLLDASASMAVPDSRNGVTRLDFAKEIADQIVGRMNGESVALDAFTSQVSQLSPSTMDYLFVRLMIRQTEINEGNVPGTDIKAALEEVRKRYFVQTPKLKTLILLSDGGDTEMEALQGEQKEQRVQSMVDLVGNAASLNLRVYTIGMGTKKGGAVPDVTYHGQEVDSFLEDELLRKLARRGRGEYFYANSMSSLEIADEIFKSMRQDNPYLEESMVLKPAASFGKNLAYDLYFQLPLGLAILLLMYVMLYPDVEIARVRSSYETISK